MNTHGDNDLDAINRIDDGQIEEKNHVLFGVDMKTEKPDVENDNANIRRSARKRSSRYITIDGYTINKSNNYSLETGELSVWDRELNGETTYDDTKTTPTVKKSYYVKKVKTVTEKSLAFDERKAQLHSHNEHIKADLEASHNRKKDFIRQNWRLLSPFLDPNQVCPPPPSEETIKAIESFKVPPLATQPSCLSNVEMREYQLAGVNWVRSAYHSLLMFHLSFITHYSSS